MCDSAVAKSSNEFVPNFQYYVHVLLNTRYIMNIFAVNLTMGIGQHLNSHNYAEAFKKLNGRNITDEIT